MMDVGDRVKVVCKCYHGDEGIIKSISSDVILVYLAKWNGLMFFHNEKDLEIIEHWSVS